MRHHQCRDHFCLAKPTLGWKVLGRKMLGLAEPALGRKMLGLAEPALGRKMLGCPLGRKMLCLAEPALRWEVLHLATTVGRNMLRARNKGPCHHHRDHAGEG